MARFCVDISHLTDEMLSFFGYDIRDENDEFKIYTDKSLEDHIVEKARPRLYVEDVNDAVYLAATNVVALPGDIDD
jgi:hypothetical protein